MATAVRISDKLVNEAKKYSRVDHRSITGQIEHWAKIGKCAEENPDLTYTSHQRNTYRNRGTRTRREIRIQFVIYR